LRISLSEVSPITSCFRGFRFCLLPLASFRISTRRAVTTTERHREAVMQTHAARLASFESAPRKRNQPKSLPSWPHPDTYGVTPATLADAGYYYDPQPGSAPDNVNCVYCENGLQDWEEDDDALNEHCRDITKGPRAGTRCPYAIVKKAMRDYQTLGQKACEDPGSDRMLEARRGTFGKWWTFDSIPGWGPTSNRVGIIVCSSQSISWLKATFSWLLLDSTTVRQKKRPTSAPVYTVLPS
jgi:hypothetical protein